MRTILDNDKLSDRAFVGNMLDIRIDDPKPFVEADIDWRVTGWLAREDPKVAAISYSVRTLEDEISKRMHAERISLALGLPQVPCVTMKSVEDAFSGSGWSFHTTIQITPDSGEPDQQLGIGLVKQFGGVTAYFQPKEARCAHGAKLYRYY